MNVLFKDVYYDPIMDALNLPSDTPANNCQHQPNCTDNREHKFRLACENVPALVDTEIEWLWNYLKHCAKTGKGGWESVPEAMQASVGW